MCLKINAKKELVPFAAAADLLSRELSLLHMVILCCLLSHSPLLVSLPLKAVDLAVTLFSSFFFFSLYMQPYSTEHLTSLLCSGKNPSVQKD